MGGANMVYAYYDKQTEKLYVSYTLYGIPEQFRHQAITVATEDIEAVTVDAQGNIRVDYAHAYEKRKQQYLRELNILFTEFILRNYPYNKQLSDVLDKEHATFWLLTNSLYVDSDTQTTSPTDLSVVNAFIVSIYRAYDVPSMTTLQVQQLISNHVSTATNSFNPTQEWITQTATQLNIATTAPEIQSVWQQTLTEVLTQLAKAVIRAKWLIYVKSAYRTLKQQIEQSSHTNPVTPEQINTFINNLPNMPNI